MSLPGTTVTLVDTPPPRSAPTDTSVSFVVGLAEKGTTEPTPITSMRGYAKSYGARVSYGVLYDTLDVFFHEGGGRAIVARAVGPNAVLAKHSLRDGTGGTTGSTSLIVNAKSFGDWANTLSVEVAAGVAGGTFVIVVYDSGVEVERSGDLATTADAVAWSVGSSYVDLVQGSSTTDPTVVTAGTLTGGTDDHANVTSTELKAALDTLGSDLGPGQVSMPGYTTDTAHTDLLEHAATHNRFALLDFVDTKDEATLAADAVDARTENARWGQAFTPWAVVPGIVAKTTRTVPYSAVQAGILARNDSRGLNPDVPAAGLVNGSSIFAIDLSQPSFSDDDRESLNDAGITVAIRKFGSIVTYGERTLANPTTEENYLQAANMRLVMAITAEADVIAENYLFRQIDGEGHLLADFKGDLVGMLKPYYDAGALYGATPAEAFIVDVGPQVNTPETLAALELHALLSLRMSPAAERVEIEIAKHPITEAVA